MLSYVFAATGWDWESYELKKVGIYSHTNILMQSDGIERIGVFARRSDRRPSYSSECDGGVVTAVRLLRWCECVSLPPRRGRRRADAAMSGGI